MVSLSVFVIATVQLYYTCKGNR